MSAPTVGLDESIDLARQLMHAAMAPAVLKSSSIISMNLFLKLCTALTNSACVALSCRELTLSMSFTSAFAGGSRSIRSASREKTDKPFLQETITSSLNSIGRR